MRQIVDLNLEEIQNRLTEQKIKLSVSDAARNWLAEKGYDPAFGARPLRRALQKHLESPLSLDILGGKFVSGDTVIVEVDDETDDKGEQKLKFSVEKKKSSKSHKKREQVESVSEEWLETPT